MALVDILHYMFIGFNVSVSFANIACVYYCMKRTEEKISNYEKTQKQNVKDFNALNDVHFEVYKKYAKTAIDMQSQFESVKTQLEMLKLRR